MVTFTKSLKRIKKELKCLKKKVTAVARQLLELSVILTPVKKKKYEIRASDLIL